MIKKDSKNDLEQLIIKAGDSSGLSEAETKTAFEVIMSGQATQTQIANLLTTLAYRGETVAEITGATRIMRAKALSISAPKGAIDTCGTGGDASGTFNISTAVSFVVAACDVPVAKHGNRKASSRSGTADVLEELGVNLDATTTVIERALKETNLGFLFAPRHHSSMKHVASVRAELGIRTIFNLLGPLSNPAGAKHQLLGVFSEDWLVPMAKTLKALGSEKAWIVHGSDGLDELTVTGPSQVAQLRNGDISTFSISPEDAGLSKHHANNLKGGEPKDNAKALMSLLEGAKGAYRDIVLLNSAAALIIASKTDDLRAGVVQAAAAIDSGKAKNILKRFVAITRGQN